MCCKKKRNVEENQQQPKSINKKKEKGKNGKKGKDTDTEKEPLEQNHGTLNNTISKKQQDKEAKGSPVAVKQVPQESERTRAEKCGSCCKKFVAFLFSTIGLTCVLCGYTIFGGFIFMWLESPNEVQLKNEVQVTRKFYIEKLWNLTIELNVFHPQNWTDLANSILQNYTTEVYKATKYKGWDGKDGETELQWTFAGSLLYSITVITTIGYGHIAPKTEWGKIVTIIYAVFGIPICVLTLTNLGGFMATAFRFIYHKVCCGFCCLCCICCQMRCRKSTSTGTSAAAAKYRDPKNGEAGASVPLGGDPETGGRASRKKKVPLRVYWTHGIQRAMKTDDNATLSVPMYVSLCLIGGYITAGALMFSLWENWTFLVGYYFCFITLSTIGFGDYVPGTTINNWDSQEKLVLVALYLLFGLALCAMCFDLMQEEARNKIKFIGRKIGLIKDERKAEKKKDKEISKSPSSQISDPVAVDG